MPPLYRRIHDLPPKAGVGVSMIDAVGDLQHPPEIAEHLGPHGFSFETCTSPPTVAQLRAFSLFEWMTFEQALALGVVFRPISPATDAPGGALAFVWRSGKIAECACAHGRSIVYGSEWDLALFIKTSDNIQRAATITELQKALPANKLLAIGASVTNPSTDLSQTLQGMASEAKKSGLGRLSQSFVVDFDKVRMIGSAVPVPAIPIRPIGISSTH